MKRFLVMACAMCVAAVPGWAGSERDVADPLAPPGSVKPADPNSPVWDGPRAVLFDNGPLVSHPGAGVGGADESWLQTALGMTIYGFGHQVSAGIRIADDFTIPPGETWDITNVIFFAYQSFAGTTSTITAVNLRIWDGLPGGGGSVIWGDMSTNIMSSTAWSDTYRVRDIDTGANTDRAVMANVTDVVLTLGEGTYWLDWATDGSATSGPWAPPVTIIGETTTGDGLQSTDSGVTYVPVTDIGGQGFPFILEGTVQSSDNLVCNSPAVAFESGIPAPWPVQVWTGPVYWSTTDDLAACDNGGNQTLGSGEAACADSDNTNLVGDPYDTELFSASFDLTGGYTEATLRFAAAYNDIGTADLFEVWVWYGGIGTLALQWDEDHNEIVTLDLSSYLGQPDVQVSFRYYGDGWDFWVQVDDVSLSCTDIFYDGFESGDTTAWMVTVP